MAAAPGVVGGGNKLNPLSLMQMFLQYGAQGKGQQAKAAADDRARRNKLWDDQKETKINEPWEPFNSRIRDRANITRQAIFDGIYNNEVSPTGVEKNLIGVWKPAMDYSDQVAVWKNTYTTALDIIDNKDEGKFYKKNTPNPDEDARGAIHDVFFYPDGSPRENEEIQSSYKDKINGIWNNPKYLDKNAVIEDFMANLDVNIEDHLNSMPHPEGKALSKSEISSKLPYKTKVVGEGAFQKVEWDLNEKGERQLIMNDMLFGRAMSNPKLSSIIREEAGDDPEKQKEWIANNTPNFDKTSIKTTTSVDKVDKENRRYYAFGSGFRIPIADLEDRDNRLEQIVTKNRPDLLAGLSDPNSDLAAYYADKEGKPIKPGQKPESIALIHVGRTEKDNEGPVNANDLTSILDRLSKSSLDIKPEIYPIGTDEERRKTKIAMSLRLDKLDTKRSIGEEYSNYVEAKRKSGTKSIAEQMKEAAKKK